MYHLQMPADHFDEFRLYRTEEDYEVDIAAGAGVDNADIILYVSAKSLAYCVRMCLLYVICTQSS